MKQLTNRLLVISFDSLSAEDFEFIKELPAFKEFLTKASVCTNVSSVYPSLTYPAHTSIVTGLYPKNHGIINNTLFQPERMSPDWFWQQKYIKSTTLYDEAIAHKMNVAALLWPVTAKSKIQYNVPEIFANRRWNNQTMTSLSNGSKGFQISLMKKYGRLLDGKKQPALDNFTHEALKYTLRKKQPELTLVHFTDLDTQRHNYGIHSPEAYDAIRRHDVRLKEVIQTLKEAAIYNDTTFILLGDHGQKDVDKVIYLNKFFADHGFLEIHHGKLRSWKAICKSCDGSAYIYIHKRYSHIKDKVFGLLNELKQRGDLGIENIYIRRDAVAWGADPKCSFMIEAADDYYFSDGWERYYEDTNVEKALGSGHFMRATHGYLPSKVNYQTVFMASGPGIRQGVELDKISLVDEGPTMARLLGLELLGTDGKILTEILDV